MRLLPSVYPAFDNLKLQPLTVVFALMAGGQVGGIAGTYLSYQQSLCCESYGWNVERLGAQRVPIPIGSLYKRRHELPGAGSVLS